MASALAFYARASEMTDLVEQQALFAALPGELSATDACRVSAGLLTHEFRTRAPGEPPSPPRHPDAQLRSAKQMLTRAWARECGPLTRERRASQPATVICRHFAVLVCALLRLRGVPARARCGFAS